MQATTAQAEMCRITAHCIRVATRRVDDTLFMQLRMGMGIFRPRLMQLHTQPKRATPIVLDHSLVQSITTDVRDEKSADDDAEEDEVITRRSPQKPSPRNRAEERSRTDWELLIRNKLAQSLRAGLEDNMTLQKAMAFAKEEFISRYSTWTCTNWAKSPRLESLDLGPGDVRYTHLQPHH